MKILSDLLYEFNGNLRDIVMERKKESVIYCLEVSRKVTEEIQKTNLKPQWIDTKSLDFMEFPDTRPILRLVEEFG